VKKEVNVSDDKNNDQAGTGNKDFSDAEERKQMKEQPVKTETPYAEHAGQDEGAEHEEEDVE
jgi:hypothetical protein